MGCKWQIHGVQVANKRGAAQEVVDSWYAAYKVADPWGEALAGRFIECKWPIHWVQLTKWLIHYVQSTK